MRKCQVEKIAVEMAGLIEASRGDEYGPKAYADMSVIGALDLQPLEDLPAGEHFVLARLNKRPHPAVLTYLYDVEFIGALTGLGVKGTDHKQRQRRARAVAKPIKKLSHRRNRLAKSQ